VRFRGLPLALAAALALAASACGGDDEPASTPLVVPPAVTEAATDTGAVEEPTSSTPEAASGETADPAVIADAAASTAAQRSARVATSLTVTGADGGAQDFGGEGAFDFERRTGEVALSLDAAQSAPFSEATVVFVDSAAYFGLPPGALPGGKRWLKLELETLADSSSLDFGPLLQGSQADPSQYLLWLEALGPGVIALGQEEVRGVTTTRYRALVDLGRLRKQGPRGQKQEWQAYVDTLQARLGLDAIPVEIWVDSDGLIRRLRHEYAYAGEGTATSVTTELFDFGVQVDTQAPPPGQVADIGDFIRP
jgi:hypothetical protein